MTNCANSPKPTCEPKPNALPNFANPSQNHNVSLSGNSNQSQKQASEMVFPLSPCEFAGPSERSIAGAAGDYGS